MSRPRSCSRFVLASILAALVSTPILAQVPNDECATAQVIPIGSTFFDTTLATNSPDPFSSSLCPGTGLGVMNRDIWFSFDADPGLIVTVSTCGIASFDTDIVVYDGPCGALTEIACNGDGPAATCPGFTSSVSFFPGVTTTTTYRIRVGGWDATEFGPGQLMVQTAPAMPGDECMIPLGAFDGLNPFDTTAYTDSSNPYDDAQCPGSFLGDMARDGWWQFSPPISGDMTISLCGLSTFDSDLVVYQGSCFGLTQIACNGDSCGLPSELTVPVSAGASYTIRLGSWSPTDAGAVGQFAIAVVPSTAPFKRGDVDGNGCVDAIADTVYLLGNLFPLPGQPPNFLACRDAADVNDDGNLNVADVAGLLGWGFPPTGTVPVLPPPGADACGPDLTPSGLDCASYVCNPCPIPPVNPSAEFSLVAGPPGATVPVDMVVSSTAPIAGYSFGVCHGSATVSPLSVDAGPGLLSLGGGAGPDLLEIQVIPGAGWTAGVIASFTGSISIPPSTGVPHFHALYSCSGGPPVGLDFCGTLGTPPVPVGYSIPPGFLFAPLTSGATISCGAPPPGSFIRGDVSGDGVRDQTDAILLEQFLYPGVLPFGPPPEPLGCDLVPNQSGDVNDNEVETIADLLMFQHYLDCGAISIPGPSALCGDDVDDETLGFDVIDSDYLLSAFTISVTGDVDDVRAVDVLLQVKSPTSIKALALSLTIGAGLSLAPVPLTVAGGVSADFFGTLVDGNLVSVAAGSVACGTPMMPSTGLAFAPIAILHLELAPFAVFPPCELVQEATVLGHVRRTTVVDELYQDHQPLFLSGSGTIFARGNANNLDFQVNIADAIWVLGHLFPQPVSLPLDCVDAADANDDGNVDIADSIYLLAFLFSSGPIIPYPYPECGYDIDIDAIDVAYPGTQCETPICP